MRDEVIERHLLALEQDIRLLQPMRQRRADDIASEAMTYYGVLYALQRCIQNIIDVGSRLLSVYGVRSPDDYKSVMRELGRAQIIAEPLATRLVGAVGFRNILVHHYLEVDWGKAYATLHDGLGDFERFIDEIRAWMEQHPNIEEHE